MDFWGYLDHIRVCVVDKLSPALTRESSNEASPGATSVADRVSREEVRRENEHLATELDVVQREYKKLKQIVDQLGREYEDSKEFDPVRRYKRLKGMIKRTVLHLHLDPDQKGSTQRVVGIMQGCKEYAQQMESQKRRGERIAKLEKEDIVAENRRMQEQIKESRRKCSIIRDLIIQMEQGYHNSKRYVMIQRYQLIKNMIKTVIHDKLI
ncbi:uncharacterized protein LOC121380087 isoform X2 [Gigantopelta aegis]|uniref:uncharacterized protein LOC121380087 isoform X2 n=1 Tax=Gigantopelta aegis TaxID=1735272 RepID=UPI001B88CA30|nr:uncharacterized protein LOC121380087 isoform X2 [Gigantopelta aegis]